MRPALLSIILAALCSCTSVSVKSPTGELVNIQNSFGTASIASVTTPAGMRVEGFQSDHSQVTKDVAAGWFSFRFWRSFWLGPVGQGAGDLLQGGAEAIKNSTN